MEQRRTSLPARAPGGARRAVAALMAVAMTLVVVGAIGVSAGSAGALPCSPAMDTCGDDGGDDGGGGGGGGGGGSTVLTVPSVYIAGRTDTLISIGWFVSDAASSYTLEHLVNGAWTTLQSYTAGGEASYDHGSLPRDSRHCYRVVARRGAQVKTSDPACAWTKDGLILRNVWRVQVRITTADVANADTEDEPRVAIHGPINGESGGGTWLDHDEDDFERGSTRNYDLINLEGIDQLGDIEGIELRKPGSDSWCVQSVGLVVNDALVFARNFGDPCQSLNGTDVLNIDHDTMHNDPWFRGYRIPYQSMLGPNSATLVISHDQLEGRIESEVGDATHGTDAYWAPPDAVELTRTDAHRAHVDLDLKADVTTTDPDVDVDFDMVVGTHKDNTGKWFVDVDVQNPVVDIQPAWYQWVVVAMSAGIELTGPERRIENTLDRVALEIGIAQIYKLEASFDDAGNLVIFATLQCPMGPGPQIPQECLAGNHL